MTRKNMFYLNELAPSHMPRRVKKTTRKIVTFRTPVTKLNKEMIIRKSIHDTFHEYMTNSSFSGVRFLVERNKSITERLMWCAIIAIAVFCFFYFMGNNLESQNAQPTYMTLEDATYPVENIIFPAIAICNHNRIKRSAFNHLVDVLYAHNNTTFSSRAELYEIAKLYGSLYDFALHNRQDLIRFHIYLDNLENKIDEKENIKKKDIRKLLKSLTPSCEETLLRCRLKGSTFNCSSLFRMEITQFGYCCTFNYYNTEAGKLEKDPLDPVDKPLRMSDGNRLNSLTLVMQANTEEYLYVTRLSYGFDLLFFDRYDYADQTAGGLVHRLIPLGAHYDVTVSPYSYYTVPAVRRLPLEKRGCKFIDEMKEDYHHYYSMSNCLVRCRMRTIERLCRCVPFFLPLRSNASACSLEDLHCLNKYRQKLLFVYPPKDIPGLEVEREDSLNCPHCMPDCKATRYKINANIKLTRIPQNMTDFANDTFDLNGGDLSLVRIFYAYHELPMYRIDVTSYWYESVSYLGGLCGLFTGFSAMSLAEIFYFIFIRFGYVLVENFKKYG